MADTDKNTGDAPATEKVKYIEVQPSSGWVKVGKAVRDFDEDKIQDTKEDIDTLLVFAGLFSAVLSAFVVESYQLLQPDTESQMLFFLQRIVTQGYTLNAGFLNVTSPPQGPPPFEAPEWALQVNGLWFASLIISLATASFSMLVKSWLREYLAVESIAPQKRLRARHYRYPSLVKWKVFEIAAVLPLLLQLSLGLFFAGLCIFTAEIDARMGRTTLPLVAGWGFFLSATTVAPLLSPRCPFKLLLLKHALKLGRKHVVPYVLKVVVFTVVAVLEPARNRLSRCVRRLAKRFLRSLPDASVDEPKVKSLEELLGKLLTPEEKTVVDGPQEDIEILRLTDEMMLDDGLLEPILETLPQSRADSLSIVELITRLIHNRAVKPEPTTSDSSSPTLDVSGLSKHAYITLTACLTQNIQSLDPTILAGNDCPDFVKEAIKVLMYPPLYLLSFNPHSSLVVLNVALSAKTDDHDILRMTDGMMLDDGQVDAIPVELIKHHMDTSAIVSFVLRLIRSHIAHDEDETIPLSNLPHILDLSTLSERAYNTLMTIVAGPLLRAEPALLGDNSPRWMLDAAMILMSTSRHPLPADARQALISCLNDKWAHLPAGKALGRCLTQSDSDMQLSTITNILSSVFDVPERPNLASALQIFNVLLGSTNSGSVEPTLMETLYKYPRLASNPAAWSIFESLWRFATHAAHAFALHEQASADVIWLGGDSCFYAVLNLGAALEKECDALNALNAWWGTWQRSYAAMITFTATSPQARITDSEVDAVVEGGFMRGIFKGRHQMLGNSSGTARLYTEGAYDNVKAFPPLDYVRYLRVHVKLYQTWIYARCAIRTEHVDTQLLPVHTSNENAGSDDAKTADWSKLWMELHPAILRYWNGKRWTAGFGDWSYYNHTIPNPTPEESLAQDRELAEECLTLMDRVDESVRTSDDAELLNEYAKRNSLFPDELVTAVGLFILPDRVSQFPRLRRLTSPAEPNPELTAVVVSSEDVGRGLLSTGSEGVDTSAPMRDGEGTAGGDGEANENSPDEEGVASSDPEDGEGEGSTAERGTRNEA